MGKRPSLPGAKKGVFSHSLQHGLAYTCAISSLAVPVSTDTIEEVEVLEGKQKHGKKHKRKRSLSPAREGVSAPLENGDGAHATALEGEEGSKL